MKKNTYYCNDYNKKSCFFTWFAFCLLIFARPSLAAQDQWSTGFGQGNLEYSIQQSGYKLSINCPTSSGSADLPSSVSVTRLDNSKEAQNFTVNVNGMTFEGPFSADSKVGDENFIALLDAFMKTDATLNVDGKKIKIPRSNASKELPIYGKKFSCNLSDSIGSQPVNKVSTTSTQPDSRSNTPKNAQLSISDKAAVCAGYHTGYAIIANSSNARNDRDFSVKIVAQLDSRYGGSASYKTMKGNSINLLTDALKNKKFEVINFMLASCKEVGAPPPINTGN